MFPTRALLNSIAAAAILCASAFADTIILKTGEKLEGKILSETATELIVEVKVSAGVTDQTTITKDKVAKIEKEQVDETAWQSLKNLKLGANSLPAAQYDWVMRPLQGFVNDHPKSAHAAEAARMLAAFAEEKKRVDDGEVRLGDKWLSKDEVAKERYQINAMLAFQHMRGQVAGGDLIGALNSFEQIETNFPGARVYPDAVETAKSALATLKTAVDRAQQNYPLQQAEFEKGVANAVEPQKSELIAARQRELAQGEAAVANAERTGSKWPQLLPRSDKSITTLAQKIPTEQERLAGLEVAKMRESIKLSEQAKKEIADKKADAADETLRKATELWNNNELAIRLQPEVADLRAIASTTPEPAPEPEKTAATDASATAPGTTGSSNDEPAEPREPEKHFLLTPAGIITVIVLIAILIAGVNAYKKIRHKASDILE